MLLSFCLGNSSELNKSKKSAFGKALILAGFVIRDLALHFSLNFNYQQGEK
jgi:hypothetical protein